MNKKKQGLLLSILGIIGLIVITVGVSYAFFNYAREGTTENTVTSGKITFLYTEVSKVGKGIKLENAYPIPDEIGRKQTREGNVFDFKITSTTPNSIGIPYEVTVRKKEDSTLDEEVVKIYLTKVNGSLEEEVLLDNYNNLTQTSKVDSSKYSEKVIYNGVVPSNTSNYEQEFRLRMWIDEDTDFSPVKDETGQDIYPYNNKTFTVTINVYANGELTQVERKIYKEELLNGTDPVLAEALVPVIIEEDGTVRKADIMNEWYRYEKRSWANAIILKDETEVYESDEIIPEESIESYFVWIPKYSYQLFNLGNYTSLQTLTDATQVINIQFGTKNTSDTNTGECTTPRTAGATGNCKVGDYMTHPAFLAFDTTGFWLGKFETGYDGAKSTTSAEVDSSDSSKIIIKPNVYSWRSLTVGNMFEASYNYKRELDSHMMKNTEWGAVAYLTNSNYGRCENGKCTEIRINNNSAYITGYAGTEEPTVGYSTSSISGNRQESTNLKVDGTYTKNYLNPFSVIASTTGNYSGVYDMSGGAWEYVAGYTTGGNYTSPSGLNPTNYASKYFDVYSSTADTNWNNRILGDATGEMGPFQYTKDPDNSSRTRSSWYHDFAYFVYSSSTWFVRGSFRNGGVVAGSLAFSNAMGGVVATVSFRLVLAPLNTK